MKLVAIVLTKNSESLLRQCLESLSFADQILVLDDLSTDNTKQIAEACGAKVITRAMNGDFGEQRRFGIDAAKGDWILFIDSDEVVSEELAIEIQQVIKKGYFAYRIRRKNTFPHYEVENGSMRRDWVLRLFPKDKLQVIGRVHERVESFYPTKDLKGELTHYPYKNWSATIKKLDAYTDALAIQQLKNGKQQSFFSGVFLKPTWAFIKVYVLNKGFLDGRMGLMLAVHHAYYTFMKYAKYYVLKNSQGLF